MPEQTAKSSPDIILVISFFGFAYLNYLAWFDHERYRQHLNQWLQHHQRYRSVLNDSWYLVLTSKTFFRALVFVGLVANLSILLLDFL